MNRVLNRIINRPNWHNLRSTKPVSEVFGYDRGTPLDRVYIEDFLQKNAGDIQGQVLEIGDDGYTQKFGADVLKNEVLHATPKNDEATIVGDLTNECTLPEDRFDCFICTQTLNFIYDVQKAIRGSWFLLKEGGVMLTTVAGISQISRYDMDRWGDFWRFTTLSAQKAFAEVFGPANIEVDCYGNVLSAIAFLEGISAEELSKKELFTKDDNYQVIITVRAVKRSQNLNGQ